MKATRCLTKECDAVKLYARGLCSRCYGREYRAGRLTPQLRLGHHSLTEVDTEAATAVCSICGPTRIAVRKGPRGHECISQRRKRKSREVRNRPPAYRKYGLTDDDYRSMTEEAGGRCQICATECDLVVDHNHGTGEVRGLLCHWCNVALGFMRDDPARLLTAAAYLIRP